MPRNNHRMIYEELCNRIHSGYYDNVVFLPSERQFAEEFSVGRETIRNVFRQLKSEGIIRQEPRKGATVVRDAVPRRMERFLIHCPGMLKRKAYERLELLSSLCVAASERFAEAMLSFAPDPPPLDELIARYRRGEIQGIISIENTDGIKELEQAGVPAVVVNLEHPADVVFCGMDFRLIGRMAGGCLTAAGHQRIAVFSGVKTTPLYHEILAGFRGALAEEEIPLRPELIIESDNSHPDTAFEALCALLRSADRPTAIFALRDYRAEMVYQAARMLDLRIPEDLSVLGYDDVSWPEAAAARLTTLRQMLDTLGEGAVKLLNDYFLTGQPPKPISIAPELIERGSVAPPK